MRRLKNIAENLEAIFRKREQEEKTLNLQSLEDRVLYSAVPLPVDMADGVVDTPEPADVCDLVPDSAEANATSTLDQLDALVSDDETPKLSATISTELFPDDVADTPVAATLVAVSQDNGSTLPTSEGSIVQIRDTSLSAAGVSGESVVLSNIDAGGTLYQKGSVVNAGDEVLVDNLRNGDVFLIPDLNFTGAINLTFVPGDDGVIGLDASNVMGFSRV